MAYLAHLLSKKIGKLILKVPNPKTPKIYGTGSTSLGVLSQINRFLGFHKWKYFFWLSLKVWSTDIVWQERRKLTHVDGIEGFEAFCRKTVQTGEKYVFLFKTSENHFHLND